MASIREWRNFLRPLDLSRDSVKRFSSQVDCTVQECQLMERNERNTALMTLCMEYIPDINLTQVQSIFKLFDNEDSSDLDKEQEEEQPSQFPRYPAVAKDSITTKAAALLPKKWLSLPLFGHWFAVELYNVYLGVQGQLNSNEAIISLGSKYEIQRSVLDSCSRDLHSACMMNYRAYSVDNGACRGFMSDAALRSCEIAWTSQCTPILNLFLFGSSLDRKGVLLHQAPTYNKSGTPETVDWYVAECRMGMGKLLDPKALGDGKLNDINHAARASLYHTLNCTVVRNVVNDWPVMLAFPSTPTVSRLCLHIPVDRAMWQLEVLELALWDKAFLCSLYYGIHRLLEDSVSSDLPLVCNLPMEGVTPLKDLSKVSANKIGTFKKESRVLKFYDTFDEERKHLKPNIDILMTYGSLQNVKLEYLSTDRRLQCLSYDFIPGSHAPTSMKQFVGVLQTLHLLHQSNIVHSDVRLANIVFDQHTSHLIDFDLADFVGELYPVGYVKLDERHPSATRQAKREKIHDRFAVQYIMRVCVDSPDPQILKELVNMEVSLIDIIAKLRNFD